jgi:hypothetical protein
LMIKPEAECLGAPHAPQCSMDDAGNQER